MKLATFEHRDHQYIGVVNGDQICAAKLDTPNMIGVIEAWDRWQPELVSSRGPYFDRTEVTLLAPIPQPRRNIFCVGINYRTHAREFLAPNADGAQLSMPTHPVVFTKPPETVVGPDAVVDIPAGITDTLDYEGELAVVIGRRGRNITADAAMNHVFGYTIVNDITARDAQKRHGQWFLGKAIDTTCPMGPWILTAESAPQPDGFTIRTTVNGELRQSDSTANMIFAVPELIETISRYTTIHPGDIIATGTPAGVGMGTEPPTFLNNGDETQIHISEIGCLTNTIRFQCGTVGTV